MMTSATILFYICSFPSSAQIILHQWVSTFVFVALNLYDDFDAILDFFGSFLAVGIFDRFCVLKNYM